MKVKKSVLPTFQSQSQSRSRLSVLKRLLQKGETATQEDLRDHLKNHGHSVTQTTISRDLRRLGAVKMLDDQGRTVYCLITDKIPDINNNSILASNVKNTLQGLVLEMHHNGSLIVIRTEPGSASLVARELDVHRPAGILGTIAGDDTVFVAPPQIRNLNRVLNQLKEFLAFQ